MRQKFIWPRKTTRSVAISQENNSTKKLLGAKWSATEILLKSGSDKVARGEATRDRNNLGSSNKTARSGTYSDRENFENNNRSLGEQRSAREVMIYQKRVWVFHQGFPTPRNNKSTRTADSCFHLFRGVWTPDETRSTSFWDDFRNETIKECTVRHIFPLSS